MIIEPLYCLFARKNYDRSPIVGFVSSDECVRSSSFEKNEKEMIKRRKKKYLLDAAVPMFIGDDQYGTRVGADGCAAIVYLDSARFVWDVIPLPESADKD